MIDLDRIADALRETAEAVILPRFRALGADEIRQKSGPNDLVTVADTEAEAMLTRLLTEADPDSVVVGEEGAARDPSLLTRLDGSAPVWVVDPVDGTYNFAHGQPGFGIMVAYVVERVIRAAWIHDPLAGTTVWAVRGGGAWQGRERLHVTAHDLPITAMVGSGYARLDDGRPSSEVLMARGPLRRLANPRASAVDYVTIARGETHFAVFRPSMPWDHAPGALIVHEAGGVVRFLDGRPYEVGITDGIVLAASTEANWATLHEVLAGAA